MKLPLYLIILTLALATVLGCQQNTTYKWVIPSGEGKPVPIEIKRYGQTLFSLDTTRFAEELNRIQPDYQVFIGNNYNQPELLNQLYNFVTDTVLIKVNKKTQEVFPDLTHLETTIGKAFGRYDYFFPDKNPPVVYTYVSGMHYENPVEKNQDLLIIALDVFLGSDYEAYKYLGLPKYRINRMTPDYIPVEVMKTLYNVEINPGFRQKTLLERMIGAGKALVFLDATLPELSDTLKIGYSQKQWDWIENNKKPVWAYLVENQLFYNSSYDLQIEFMQEAPFTTGFGNESTPRLGVWLGWQIVRAYHQNHPEVSLSELINNADAQEILQESGYKP